MFLHQGVGLDAFNGWPVPRAVHALYECCYSVPFSADLARARPYPDHTTLYRHADELLFTLPEDSVDTVLQAYPCVGRRPGSARSKAEQCAVWDAHAELMAELDQTARCYADAFGFGFVMFIGGADAQTVLATMSDRLLNDLDTERKIVRNELARINRTRLERMLGPECGYNNW